MADIPWWYDAPDIWDKVTLGGFDLPGLCMVKVKRGHKLHKKKSPGTHGATFTDQGYEPADVDIEWKITEKADWATMQKLLPLIEPPPTKGFGTPFDILHPKTAARGIKSIIIETIEGPDEGSIRGQYIVKIKAFEFFRSAPNFVATNTPKTSIQPRDNALSRPTMPTDPSSVPIAPS